MINQQTTKTNQNFAKETTTPTKQDPQLPPMPNKIHKLVRVFDNINEKSLKCFSKGKENPSRWTTDTPETRAAIRDFLIIKIILPLFLNTCVPKLYFPVHNIFCVKKRLCCRGFEEPKEVVSLLLSRKDEDAIVQTRKELLKMKSKSETMNNFFKSKRKSIVGFLRALNLEQLRDFVEKQLPRRDGKVQLPCFKPTINFKAVGYKAPKFEEGKSEESFKPHLIDTESEALTKEENQENMVEIAKTTEKFLMSENTKEGQQAEITTQKKPLKVASPLPKAKESDLDPAEVSEKESKTSNSASSLGSLVSSTELKTPESERLSIMRKKMSRLTSTNKKTEERICALVQSMHKLKLKVKDSPDLTSEPAKEQAEQPESSVKSDEEGEAPSSTDEGKTLKTKVLSQYVEQLKTLAQLRALKKKKLTEALRIVKDSKSDIKKCDSQIAFLKKAKKLIDGSGEEENGNRCTGWNWGLFYFSILFFNLFFLTK